MRSKNFSSGKPIIIFACVLRLALSDDLSDSIKLSILTFFLILVKISGDPLSGAYPKFLQPDL